MRVIKNIEELIVVEGKSYYPSNDKNIEIGDLVYDARSNHVVEIQDEHDLVKMEYVPKEIYIILREREEKRMAS